MNTHLPNFFSAGLFVQNMNVLTVLHKKYSVTKLPGGTFNGDLRNWEIRGEGGAFYNPFSKKDVKKKLINTIQKSYSKETYLNHKNDFLVLVDYVVTNITTPQEIHLVVEMIEETGIIPVELDLALEQKITESFSQYFFTIGTAYTYNKDRNSIIEIKDFSCDIPENDRDFFCRDMDIDKIEILDILDVSRGYSEDGKIAKREINTAHKHKNAINGFIMNTQKTQTV